MFQRLDAALELGEPLRQGLVVHAIPRISGITDYDSAMSKHPDRTSGTAMGTAIAVGIAVGAVFGVLAGNVALGVAFGAARPVGRRGSSDDRSGPPEGTG
ncbi:hypothetical protein GCM10010464_01250 [Pseudonocardia yunnanensis]